MSYNLILLKKTNHEHDKWRLLVITLTFLFFIASFILVVLDNIFGIFDLDRNSNCSEKAEHANVEMYSYQEYVKNNLTARKTCELAVTHQCQISCTGISDSDIVKKSNFNSCGNTDIVLYLDNVSFKTNTIQKGWLSALPKLVIRLTIDSKHLSFLGKESFAGDPFTNLNSLTLVNTNIAYLERDSFIGCLVREFEFRFNVLQEVNIEYGALEYLANTLESLQLNLCNLQAQALKNLTGSTKLPYLKTIDLRFNQIDHIIDETFKETLSLIQLYLSSCKIQCMEANAFSGLGQSLQKLAINDNKLTTLPEGIFSEFHGRGDILISENRWNCDCNLEWFKKFYTDNKNNYFLGGNELFVCQTIKYGPQNYTEVDFCPSSTNVSTTTKASTTACDSTSFTTSSKIPDLSTTTASTITSGSTSWETSTTSVIISTSQPDGYINFVCEDCTEMISFNPQLSRHYSYTVSVRNGSVVYDFYQIEGTPYYDISVRNSIGTDYMIWINIDNHDDIGCVYNVKDRVILERLDYAQRYLICLLKQNEVEVSPFDCTSLVVPPNWENTPWIFNKNKVLLIVLLVVVILIVIIITAAVMYLMIRKNPKLVKATKQVVETNRNFEKEYQYINPPSFYSTSDGYLTPKLTARKNSRNYSRRRLSRKLSTISERDFNGGFNVIYDVSRITDRELYEPPPLPPNHPSKWRKIECEDENCASVPDEENIYGSKSFKSEKRNGLSPVHKNSISKNIADEHYLDCFKI